jgi:stage II sporulation protein AA (anti-sigma F factor antagonist)
VGTAVILDFSVQQRATLTEALDMLDFEDLAITIKVADASVVVAVCGEIDLLSVGVLTDALQQIDARLDVIVDCHAVSFMDSTGINALLQHWQRARRVGGSLCISRPSVPVEVALEATGLTELISPI